MPQQNFTYDEIDRLFYEQLRRAVVAANLLPDVNNYSTVNAWNAARTAKLVSLGADGRLVDVIGVGSPDDRMYKESARIIINRVGDKMGNIGGYPSTFYETQNDGKFSKYYYPDSTSDLEYEVRIMSDLTRYDRILSSIVRNTLHQRRYFKTVKPDGTYSTKDVLVIANGMVDLSEKNMIERIFRFTVMDVFMEENTLIAANIPAMTTVELVLNTTVEVEEQPASTSSIVFENTIDVPRGETNTQLLSFVIGVDKPEGNTLQDNRLKNSVFTVNLDGTPIKFKLLESITNTTTGTIDFTSLGGLVNTQEIDITLYL